MATATMPEVMMIEPSFLRDHPENPRKTITEAELANLAASIRTHGVRVPLLVRPMFNSEDGALEFYQIVAGHRRRRAAEMQDVTFLPCIPREMTDDEARQIMIVENLQREDLPPLEEADAYEGLLPALGSIESVAASVGKSVEYVTRRIKLRTLTALSRRALAEKLITIDHAMLLCKLAAKEQDEILKWTLDVNAGIKTSCEQVLEDVLKRHKDRGRQGTYRYYWEPRSVLELKSHIEQVTKLQLSRAPWDLDDAELDPSAGACSSCPKNTNANDALFGDLSVATACCTDSVCFDTKCKAFVQVKLDEIEQAERKAVRISWQHTTVKPGQRQFAAQFYKAGQWIEAKRGSCGNTVTGVAVDYPRYEHGSEARKQKPGRTLLVCVTAGCSAHPKAWEAEKPSNSAGRETDADRKARLERAKFLFGHEEVIQGNIWKTILSQMNVAKALSLLVEESWNAEAFQKDIQDALPGVKGELLNVLILFQAELSQMANPSEWQLGEKGGVQKVRKRLWEFANKLGVDADAIAAKYFHDQGSIAPAADVLYPKGVPWPKGSIPTKPTPTTKPAKKALAKKAAAKKAVRR